MPRVLFMHSGGFTSRQWRRLATELAADHEILNPDLIGYGSEPPWPAGTPFHFQRDVERLAEMLDGPPAHLVGHSYGGLLAMQLALVRPAQVRSIAVYEPVTFGVLGPEDAETRARIDTLPEYHRDAKVVDEAWLAAFVTWWQGPGAWQRLAPETQQAFRDVGWKLSQEVASLAADTTSREKYATIVAPTLVLGGALTQPAEMQVIQRLSAALPNGTLKVFPGMGHMGPITHAADVNAAIAAFVRAH
jgi:pimeloyl-ACP methyl ester carboxylesterase